MDAGDIVTLAGAGLAAAVAVLVPWMTFRFALRQERQRWLLEQRAQLYSDMLTEAYAEQKWFEYRIADAETREEMRFEDLRMPPLERARLGARGNIFGSGDVNRAFNEMQGVMFQTELSGRLDEGRVRLAGVIEELQAAVRHDLGTEQAFAASAERRWWSRLGSRQKP